MQVIPLDLFWPFRNMKSYYFILFKKHYGSQNHQHGTRHSCVCF